MALAITSLRLSLSTFSVGAAEAVEEDRVLNFLLTQDGDFITTQSGNRIRLEARAFLHTQSNDRIITEADDAILLT